MRIAQAERQAWESECHLLESKCKILEAELQKVSEEMKNYVKNDSGDKGNKSLR